jgi:hypothetical protein
MYRNLLAQMPAGGSAAIPTSLIAPKGGTHHSPMDGLVDAAIGHTEISGQICGQIRTDLCPVISEACAGDDSALCTQLSNVCGKGADVGISLSVCLDGGVPLCDVAQLCTQNASKGKQSPVCSALVSACKQRQ